MALNKHSVKYDKLEGFLDALPEDTIPDSLALVLIYGESYLLRQALKTLSSFLQKRQNANSFLFETLEGGSISMGDIIEQVSTFSIFEQKKIVVVKNVPLFQVSPDTQDINFSLSDLEHLSLFIKKGLPENHYLILTTSNIDKRKKLYKALAENGLIIDCSVATGTRKADVDNQRTVLRNIADNILTSAKKTIEPRAFNILVDLTGFNPELFSQNLEKLIVFCGKNPVIFSADIKKVIIRDKKDPIFNLTNAFMKKDVKNALIYLNSLLTEGFHPLQILRSLENQVRKLILVKCFTQKFCLSHKNIRLGTINFNSFKYSVLPEIIHDDELTKMLIQDHGELIPEKKGSRGKKKQSNDLFLAPNPKNPYPVFQVFQKSENFSLNELNQAIFFLSDLDYRLKSSSFDAKTAIENFIIKTCSKGGFVYAEKNKNRRYYF